MSVSSSWLALMTTAVLMAGCQGESGAAASEVPDAAEVTDVTDAAEVTDVTDAADASDVEDALGLADGDVPSDDGPSADVQDSTDAPDVPDVADVPAELDGGTDAAQDTSEDPDGDAVPELPPSPDTEPTPEEIPANGIDDDDDGWVDEHDHFPLTPADGDCPEPWTVSPSGACLSVAGARAYVAGGTTWMGCATEQDPDCALDEQPQHAVEPPAYAIDVFEVKASSYGDCVEAGVCEGVTDATCFWGTTTVGVGGEGEHPANCVPWGAARAYCQWAGGDLCTESQWEKAARGSCALAGLEGDDCASALPRYVWGDTPLLELAHPPGNYSDKTAFEAGAWLDWFHMLDYDDGHVTTAPVGSFPAGASPYGALDMGGNVWEWVLDCGTDSYEGAPADGSAVMPDDCTMRVARGASFDAVNPWLRVTERGGDAPDHVGQDTGFRCCY